MSMFDDQIKSTFGTDLGLAIIRARRLRAQARRNDYIDLIDLYNGAQLAILEEDINNSLENPNMKQALLYCKRFMNLTKWIINEASRVIDEPPLARIFAEGSEDSVPLTELFSQLDDLGKLWVKGAEIERYSNLTNNIAALPAVRETDDGVKLSWDIYPPDRYAIAQEWDLPDAPEAIALYFVFEDDEAAKRGLVRGYQTWTRETMRYFDTQNNEFTNKLAKKNNQVEGIGANPYKDLFGIPVTIFRIGEPLFGEFYSPASVELGAANRQLNLMRTERRLIERMQGFGQLVIINADDSIKDKLFSGATQIIQIKSDKDRPGDAKYINPSPKLKELKDSEAALLQEVAIEWGLNATDFILYEGAAPRTPASGKAKRIDNERLLKRTRTNEGYLRPAFIELIKKTLLMVKYWDGKGVKLPGIDASIIPDSMDKIRVEIKFAQEPNIQTVEDFNLFQNRAKVGMDSYADEYMTEHPEVNTREEAEAALQDAIQSNERVMQSSILKQVTASLLAAQGVLAPPSGATVAPTGAPAAGGAGTGQNGASGAAPPKPGTPGTPGTPDKGIGQALKATSSAISATVGK